MIIYGVNAVREALRGKRTVEQIWATANSARRHDEFPPSLVTVVDGDEITQRAHSDHHGGVCARVSEFDYVDADELLAADDALIVALDEVTDPQNFGAICRTAEAAGFTGVVIPERRSVHVTPAVCKASAGAVEHLPIAIVRNLTDFLNQAKRTSCWCYGVDVAENATSFTEVDYRDKTVLVFGSEGQGIRPRVAAACDALISIPMRGHVQSLNVSAAAAIVMYQALLQRSAAGSQ
jgi:23S rRNA (guanosine2251-2'-O)-methyltransferase